MHHWKIKHQHHFLRNFSIRRDTRYSAVTSSINKSWNVEAVAIVYFSKFLYCCVKWVAWFVSFYVGGTYSLIILRMFMSEVILTPLCMKEGRTFLYHFIPLQTYASQAVGASSVGASLLLIWVKLLHIKIGKYTYVPLLF